MFLILATPFKCYRFSMTAIISHGTICFTLGFSWMQSTAASLWEVTKLS